MIVNPSLLAYGHDSRPSVNPTKGSVEHSRLALFQLQYLFLETPQSAVQEKKGRTAYRSSLESFAASWERQGFGLVMACGSNDAL